ncbi:hypothetical protein [Proteiniphilum acetatigenes]|uniref:hypothetical protein n=1 Tax=Proteiniphilum acetatigenes TaxID=294710 RepID=UPI00146A3F9E|nr:hypothetical protein [Proteiniphilum acetatigenes]
MYKGPANIEKIEYTPSKVMPDGDVTVTAIITDLQDVTAAKIQYKVNGGTQIEVAMTKGSGDTYTGVIPKQADKGSYQRIPNGTGTWKLAASTNGSANPASGEDIPQQ